MLFVHGFKPVCNRHIQFHMYISPIHFISHEQDTLRRIVLLSYSTDDVNDVNDDDDADIDDNNDVD